MLDELVQDPVEDGISPASPERSIDEWDELADAMPIGRVARELVH